MDRLAVSGGGPGAVAATGWPGGGDRADEPAALDEVVALDRDELPAPPLLWSAGRSVTLPGVLGRIHGVIGFEATLTLIDAYGGGQLHIPARVTPSHPLARLIGPALAACLAARLGNDRYVPIDVPNGQVELTFVFARALRAEGHTIAEIRRLLLERHRLRVTDRRIRQLVTDIPCRRPVARRSADHLDRRVAPAVGEQCRDRA